ncbi:O-antigen ligase family protein [Pelomonas sp. UHG3]|uniref:O-antigen ligase family protein n=1 Tax=Roseateles hydrophilus TaxID=2975054 RepID=A0ACC6C547_9BURK|nr:O-antigen ligase family protein [Pelomonas sp. UHG3]MCY4743527.1 O-antigen ligase family protein [Pelomonas sp. UHG3]
MITIILIGVVYLALMMGAVALIFGGLQIHRIGREKSQRVWVALLVLVYLVPALSILVSGRNLRAAVLLEDLAVSAGVVSGLVAKAGYYGLLVLCVVLILSRILDGKRWAAVPRHAQWLMVTMFAYVAGATLLSGTFGTRPTFTPSYVGAPILFSAALLLALDPTVDALKCLRNVLLVLVAASLATAVVLPTLVLETYAVGLIPGFPLRFWGLTPHANTMGPLAAFALLLFISIPLSARWKQAAALAICFAALILAQSKTTWVAAFVALVVYFSARNLETPQDGLLRWAKVALASAAFCLAAIVVAGGGLEMLASNAQGRAFGGGEFSGRSNIWDVAIGEWKRNPLFGYGPSIWSPEYRARIGMNFAFHAHNQFYQTLSEAGVVGVALLATYLLTILLTVCRSTPLRPLALAALCFVLIRSFSEPTFRVTSALTGDAMVHFALLCVVAAVARYKPARE